jgi:integrase
MGFLDCHARPWLLFAGRLIEFVGRQVPDPRGIDRERLIDLGRGAALATVDRHFVDGFVLHRRGQGIAESTIAKERTLLRNALRLAKRADMWAGDLEDMFPAFGAEYEPKRVFLTHEQADAMLAHLQPNRRAIAAFCLATGAEKRAVIRALRVDLEAVPLPLRGTKTKDRDRACPIVLPWQRALLDVAKTHADGIDGKAFTPWENSPRDLALACGKAGVPRVSLHGLRHIFGAWALDAGLSEGLVAKALGHRDTRMLELVYDTRDPQVIQRRAERETREKDLVRNGVA